MLTPGELQTEILSGPLSAQCAPHVQTNAMPKISAAEVRVKDQAIANILNASGNYTEFQSRFCTDLTFYAEVINPTTGQIDPSWTNAILDKLDAIAASSTMVKRAMSRVYGDGLDMGNKATQDQLNAMATAGLLTADEVAALIALAKRPVTFTAQQVSVALRGPWS